MIGVEAGMNTSAMPGAQRPDMALGQRLCVTLEKPIFFGIVVFNDIFGCLDVWQIGYMI